MRQPARSLQPFIETGRYGLVAIFSTQVLTKLFTFANNRKSITIAKYDLVHQGRVPDYLTLHFTLNGGIDKLTLVQEHLSLIVNLSYQHSIARCCDKDRPLPWIPGILYVMHTGTQNWSASGLPSHSMWIFCDGPCAKPLCHYLLSESQGNNMHCLGRTSCKVGANAAMLMLYQAFTSG